MTLSDRQDILDVLNYDMADIFAMLGIDTTAGKEAYRTGEKDVHPHTAAYELQPAGR